MKIIKNDNESHLSFICHSATSLNRTDYIIYDKYRFMMTKMDLSKYKKFINYEHKLICKFLVYTKKIHKIETKQIRQISYLIPNKTILENNLILICLICYSNPKLTTIKFNLPMFYIQKILNYGN